MTDSYHSINVPPDRDFCPHAARAEAAEKALALEKENHAVTEHLLVKASRGLAALRERAKRAERHLQEAGASDLGNLQRLGLVGKVACEVLGLDAEQIAPIEVKEKAEHLRARVAERDVEADGLRARVAELEGALQLAVSAMQKNIAYATRKDEPALAEAILVAQAALTPQAQPPAEVRTCCGCSCGGCSHQGGRNEHSAKCKEHFFAQPAQGVAGNGDGREHMLTCASQRNFGKRGPCDCIEPDPDTLPTISRRAVEELIENEEIWARSESSSVIDWVVTVKSIRSALGLTPPAKEQQL